MEAKYFKQSLYQLLKHGAHLISYFPTIYPVGNWTIPSRELTHLTS